MTQLAALPEPEPMRLTLADAASLPPTLTVEEAAPWLGCSSWTLYELIKRGESPVEALRLGRRIVIPTARLLRALGIDPTGGDGAC